MLSSSKPDNEKKKDSYKLTPPSLAIPIELRSTNPKKEPKLSCLFDEPIATVIPKLEGTVETNNKDTPPPLHPASSQDDLYATKSLVNENETFSNYGDKSTDSFPMRSESGGVANKRNSEYEYFNTDKFSVMKYMLTEMLGIGEIGHLEPDSVKYMDNFLTVPSKVESLMSFGFFICLDAFLYVLTFLPLRVLHSCYLLLSDITVSVWKVHQLGWGVLFKKNGQFSLAGVSFHRSHLYDIMRGGTLFVGCYALQLLNMSRVYHYIRGQTLIKLYVLTAMMEIFDKLLCSFGEDAFDSMYCITRMRPEMTKIAFSFVVACVYVIMHAGMYFMYVATLTVAINSSDQVNRKG